MQDDKLPDSCVVKRQIDIAAALFPKKHGNLTQRELFQLPYSATEGFAKNIVEQHRSQ